MFHTLKSLGNARSQLEGLSKVTFIKRIFFESVSVLICSVVDMETKFKNKTMYKMSYEYLKIKKL